VRVGRHPHHPPAVDVGLVIGERPHHLPLLCQSVDRPAPERLVRAGVRLLKPAVELQLVVEVVREPPAGLVLNRRMSPIAARNVAAQITFTPGTLISRLASGHESIWRAINRSTSAISASRNSTWRMHP
jgi:hypothetical protein